MRRCETYDEGEVLRAVTAALDDLGGISAFVKPGEKVLLKANLLMEKRPEDATLTHPAVLKAMIEILTANGNPVTIGDSPGGPFNDSMLSRIYRTGGYAALADQTGAALNRNYASCSRENPRGLLLKRLTMTDMLNDHDKVISVSKLKTHGMMTYTGAVKNLFGTIPGIMKAEYHLNMPEYDNFADALIDICLAANPVLSVMDGIVGMEGHGPSAGEPRSLGVLLAGANPFALDRIACEIISLPPEKVPTLRRAIARELSGADLPDITTLGDAPQSFKVSDFAIPKPSRINPSKSLPPFIQKAMSRVLQPRPHFLHDKCVGCGVCGESCPVKVISFPEKRKPKADLDGCIRCYCCQELCPVKAVVIKRPLLMKLFVENAFSSLTGAIIKKIQYRKRT